LSSGPSPLGRPKCEETWCLKNKDQFSKKSMRQRNIYLQRSEDMSTREDLRQRGHPWRQGT
jgi:hypothetical protein